MIRLATTPEIEAFGKPDDGYETIGFVMEREGEVVGHVALSRDSRAIGSPLLHTLACWSDDKFDAVRLCFRARRFLREAGFDSFLIHHSPDAPKEIVDFWIRVGAKHFATIYRVQC